MFKLRAVIHCPGFLHGTSCTCLAAVSLAIYQCDGAKPRQCGIRHWLNCFYQSAPYRNGGYQSAGIAEFPGIIAAVDGSHLGSQLALTTLGASLFTDCVVNLSSGFWITRVERIEQLGSASLLWTPAMCAISPLLLCVFRTGAGDHSHYRFRAAYLWMLSAKCSLVTAIRWRSPSGVLCTAARA